MRVFLIHGMGRTPISMWVLKFRLERAGYRTSLFGYLVTVSDLDRIAERFAERVRREMAAEVAAGHGSAAAEDDGAPSYAVVGHSLGNIITRLASPELPPGFRRFVMLAPPNRSPVIARTLGNNELFRAATRDAGEKLIDERFYSELPELAVPSIIIAGTRGPRARWLPFGGEPNDSILRVDETRLEGVPAIDVHGVHSFLMNRRDVFAAVRRFLESGEEPAC